MRTIEYMNIVQLHPVRSRAWKVYAQEPKDGNETVKFFADEIECWALIENVRECQKWESAEILQLPAEQETHKKP